MNNKKTVLGTIDKTKKGSGYLIVENNEKDFFISISFTFISIRLNFSTNIVH